MVNEVSIDSQNIKDIGDAANGSASSLGKLESSASTAQLSIDLLGVATKKAGNILNSLNNSIRDLDISFNTSKSLTSNQITQFTLLSTAALGARDSYNSFMNVDTSGLNTFTDQIKYMTQTLGNTESGIGTLVDIAKNAFGAVMPEYIKKSLPAAEQFVLNLARQADNALKLQNGIIQLAAHTGNLNNVFALAGTKLENINALIQKHSEMISQANLATGVAPEIVEKYYSELGQIPGALESLVSSSGSANERTTMLTAAMKMAAGTGRSFEEVMDDLKTAFREYGLTGESALTFSAQISAVTQNLGVELSTVKDALRSGADSFKMFASAGESASNMASGLADIMNDYAKSLESTNVSGTVAVDIVRNMTGQISQMGIAQKSFLSSQTGGAGGLMGAFQIDKMMRDGDIKGVFEKVKQQMQKQFGSIVTLNEASQSQSAAAQMTKQMMILRQGPLGQFARSDVEAQRILEGLRASQDNGDGGVNPDILKDAMDKGTTIQEKSYTVMNEIRGHVEAIRRVADAGSLGFMQGSGLTAGSGDIINGTMQNEAAERLRNGLRSTMTGASNMDTLGIEASYAQVAAKKEQIRTTGTEAIKAFNGLADVFGLLPDVIKGPTEALKQAITSGDVNKSLENIKLLEADLANRKSQVKSIPIDKRKSIMDQIAKEEVALNRAKEYYASISSSGANIALATATGNNQAMPAGNRVGMAAVRVSGASNLSGDGSTSALPGINNRGNIPATSKQDVNVHITGFCLKCRQEIDNSAQANAINPQGRSL